MRIGKSFRFTEDMYSLMFIGQVLPVYINWCRQSAEKREDLLTEMIKKHEKEEIQNTIHGDSEVSTNEDKGRIPILFKKIKNVFKSKKSSSIQASKQPSNQP